MFCSNIAHTGNPPQTRSYHASTVIENGLYIHGGINNKNQVLSDLHMFDVQTKIWSKLEPRISAEVPLHCSFKLEGVCQVPALSHHCSLSYKNRYIVCIGGWNGRKRMSEVFVFDVTGRVWYKMNTSGDIPVGLSSHTGSFVSENEILVVGREGGVHTQRRTGNAFILNINTGVYKSQPFNVDSRSGHTADLVHYGKERGYQMFVYSGRKTGSQYNTVGKWNNKFHQGYDINCTFAQNVVELIKKTPSIDAPEGRQNCRSLCIGDKTVLVYGGELWKPRDNITSDVFVFDLADFKWHQLPTVEGLPKLVGFSLNVGIDRKCYIFGGYDGKHCNNNIWNLEVSSS